MVVGGKRAPGVLLLIFSLVAGSWWSPSPALAFMVGVEVRILWWTALKTPPIHEEITADAIAWSDIDVGPNFLANLKSGVRNADFVHMFDEEVHFDNASVAKRWDAFDRSFDYVHSKLTAARESALDNPEFTNPTFTSFGEIARPTRTLLTSWIGESCSRSSNLAGLCTNARTILNGISRRMWVLEWTPNPDPHEPTNPDSLFAANPDCLPDPSQTAGFVAAVCRATVFFAGAQRKLVSEVGRALVLLATPSDAAESTRLMHQYDAYLAFQDAGHALHAAQDFFAHSNYVELMTGGEVGEAIATRPGSDGGSWRPSQVEVPTAEDFDLGGLVTLLDDAVGASSRLETGNVTTAWLGEYDGCAAFNSIFNPLAPLVTPAGTLFGYSIPWGVIPLGGNPSPDPRFGYCHYTTSTTEGLNKDHACKSNPRNVTDPATCDERSHVNFYFARRAAVKLSGNLLEWLFTPPSPPEARRR